MYHVSGLKFIYICVSEEDILFAARYGGGETAKNVATSNNLATNHISGAFYSKEYRY